MLDLLANGAIMAISQPLCSHYHLLNNFCYHQVPDKISPAARRQTAIYKHAEFLMQNSAEPCTPCGSPPFWEKIIIITSEWKQCKYTCLKLQTTTQMLFLVLKGTAVPILRFSIWIIPSGSLEWNPQHTLFTWRSLFFALPLPYLVFPFLN